MSKGKKIVIVASAVFWLLVLVSAVIDKQRPPSMHMDAVQALTLCEQYARSWAKHPSTVNFTYRGDEKRADGHTLVNTTFTAKNSMGFELKFDIRCLFDRNRLLDASISEATR